MNSLISIPLYVVVVVISAIPLDDNIFHYNGYQVIRTFPSTREHYEALRALQVTGHLDFWSDLRNGKSTDIMVSPEQMEQFQQYLSTHGISYGTFIPDVEKIISEQRKVYANRVKSPEFDWDDYHGINKIQSFVHQLAKDNPHLASVLKIGKSYEGRDILVVKISTGGSGKSGVFIDGNIHAREWISPAVVTFIMNDLVKNPDQNLNLLSVYDFYFVPNVNPDGYEYSRSTQRLWRKTRSNYNATNGCRGADGNRNWGYKWGDPGASPEKCSDTYMGPNKFSESENDAIQKFILSTPANWLYFITLHSYGQYCLVPFGDGSRPTDYNDILYKGNRFADAIYSLTGTVYSVGNSRDLLYETSGTSQDWAKGTANIKYSYTIELRDQGTWGFLLPPSEIKETSRETWAGIKALVKPTNFNGPSSRNKINY